MKKQFLVLIGLLVSFISPQKGYPQADKQNFSILCTSSENSIRLLWLPYEWPEGMQGFEIKRREIKRNKPKDWVAITSSAIEPGNSINKDLSGVEPDNGQRKILEEKRRKFMQGAGQKFELAPLSKQEFLNQADDEDALAALSYLLSRDFDVARMFGFGMIDREVPKAEAYEYALVGKWEDHEEIMASLVWEYGSKLQIDIPVDIELQAYRSKDKLDVEFIIDHEKYLAQQGVRTFSIYKKEEGKDYEALREDINISGYKGKASIRHTEKNLSDSAVYYYAIRPVTIFNTLGQPTEVKYDPTEIPGVFPDIELSFNKAYYNERRDGVHILWNFQEENEKFIEGFYVVRKTDSQIDTLEKVAAEQRTFIDRKLPTKCLVGYKVVADLKGNYPNESSGDFKSKILDYRPPVPSGLQAKYTKEDNDEYILLTWNKKATDDTLTRGYRIFRSRENDFNDPPRLYGHVSLPADQTSYRYTVGNAMYSDTYAFAISGLPYLEGGRDPRWCYGESDTSEFVRESIPTHNLNFIILEKEIINENTVKLIWEYSTDYWDLAGFRLFLNGELIADHTKIGPETREYILSDLEKGIYDFELQAYTTYDYESRISNTVRFYVRKQD